MGGRPGGRACLQGRLCTLQPPAGGRDCAGNAKGPRYSPEPSGQESPPVLAEPLAPSPRLVTLLSSPYWKVVPLQFLRVSGKRPRCCFWLL